MWLLVLATLACATLHFSPRGSVRELICATLTMVFIFTIPAGYLAGAW